MLATDLRADGLAGPAAAGARTVTADLSTEEGRAGLVAAADAWLAADAGTDGPLRLDWLVNAAGVIVLRPIGEVSTADLRFAFATNVESTFVLCQQLGDADARRRRDRQLLLPLGEVRGDHGGRPRTRSPRRPSRRSRAPSRWRTRRARIRVNALSPGITDTPMQERVLREVSASRGIPYEELAAARLRTVPMGRSAPPSEMAGMVAWLLSDEAAYLTGQVINVDGGMVMW